MAFRDDLQALQARHEALESEVARTQRERDQVRGLLDEAKTRARLPVLDNISVASPCHADWAQMAATGDDRVRNCGDCRKNVYNLIDMTRDEAEALIVEQAGNLCVRYFQRHDGTILLADCTVGAKRRRRRKLVMIAGATALLATGGIAAYKKLAHDAEEQVMMGQLRLEEPLPREMKGELAAPPRAYPSQVGRFIMGK